KQVGRGLQPEPALGGVDEGLSVSRSVVGLFVLFVLLVVPLFVLVVIPLFVVQFLSAVLAEPRVELVRGSAGGTRRGGMRGFGRAEPLHQITFDLLAVASTGVELTHQSRGSGPETARHLTPVAKIGRASCRDND